MRCGLDYWREQCIDKCREDPALLPHVAVVALRARRFAATLGLSTIDQETCEACGLLHDLGKIPSLHRSGFHPLDGAAWLRDQGEDRLAALVAHHGNAAYEAEQRGIAIPFLLEDGPVLPIVDYSDATTLQSGRVVPLKERLDDIAARYGAGSLAMAAMRDAWNRLQETERMLSATGATQPLST